MSLQPAPSSPQAAAKRNLFKLQHAGQHAQWKSNLQDYMFDKFHDVNMDKITSVFTLDIDFFAKHSDFKDDCKVHSKDNHPAYGVVCFDHAIVPSLCDSLVSHSEPVLHPSHSATLNERCVHFRFGSEPPLALQCGKVGCPVASTPLTSPPVTVSVTPS